MLAQAVGAPVQVSLGELEPGQLLKVQWRGQTIGILRRTEETLSLLSGLDDRLRDPDSAESEQPEYTQNTARALKDAAAPWRVGSPGSTGQRDSEVLTTDLPDNVAVATDATERYFDSLGVDAQTKRRT